MPILDEDQIQEISDLLDDKFDSHAFIFEFMKRFPVVYTQRLHEHVDTSDPIRIFHAEIGKMLKRWNDLEALGKLSSNNVRGMHSANEQWRKI